MRAINEPAISTHRASSVPRELSNELLSLRCIQGLTWKQISRRTPTLNGWKKVRRATAKRFPGLRISSPDLQRWYDDRISRIARQMRDTKATAQLIARLAKQECVHTNASFQLQEAFNAFLKSNRRDIHARMSAINDALYHYRIDQQEVLKIQTIFILAVREFFGAKIGRRTA